MEILRLFYDCDEFCADFLPRWQAHLLAAQAVQRQRTSTLSLSEVMTIVILFHQSGYRNFTSPTGFCGIWSLNEKVAAEQKTLQTR